MDLRSNQIERYLGFALTQMYPVFSGDPHYFFMALNQQLHSLISSGGLWRLSPLTKGDGGEVIDGVTQLIKTN